MAPGRRHWKGEIPIPAFIASGNGRDLYLDPQFKGKFTDEKPKSTIAYIDDETGKQKTLRWWSRLPASANFLDRMRKQQQMAERLSKLPTIDSKRLGTTKWTTEQREMQVIVSDCAAYSLDPCAVFARVLVNQDEFSPFLRFCGLKAQPRCLGGWRLRPLLSCH